MKVNKDQYRAAVKRLWGNMQLFGTANWIGIATDDEEQGTPPPIINEPTRLQIASDLVTVLNYDHFYK